MKIRRMIVFSLLALTLLLPLAAQADPPEGACSSPKSETGNHSWFVYASSPATCTDRGWAEWNCRFCGQIYNEYFPASGHSWGPWREYPDCENESMRQRQCQVCGEWESETVPPLGHNWDSGVVTSPATCASEGVRTYTCARCGKIRTEAIAKTNHQSEKVTEYPTCTEPGSSIYVCAICGQKLTNPDYLPALGHDWDAGTVTAQPSCTAEGVRTYTCARCGQIRTEAIPKTNHQSTKVTEAFPTCTEAGSSVYQCAICGLKLTNPDYIAPLGHDWDDGKVTASPTCTSEGVRTYTCARCGAIRTESIQKTNHQSVKVTDVYPTCTEAGSSVYQCAICGLKLTNPDYLAPLGHDWDNGKVTKKPTCTAEGEKIFTCARCGETRTEAIEKADHLSTKVTEPPTCTEPGTSMYICAICGQKLTNPDTTPALGHDWDGGKVTREATCAAEGVKTFTCARCGETRTEAIPALGHTPVSIPAVAATCTTGGKTEGSKCSVCGAVITAQQATKALGHEWDQGTVAEEATCTEEGLKLFTCTRCKAAREETIPALGHTPVSIPAVAATCTAAGKTEGSKCAVCGEVLTAQQTVKALGHEWDDGKATKEATCTEDGVKTFTCVRCGETHTEEIPATGHINEEIPAKEATCTESGSTPGIRCSLCGTVLDQPQKIPALDHNWDNGKVTTEPGCTEEGVKTFTCIRCDKTRTEPIPALDHDWDEGAITTEPGALNPGELTYTCLRCGETETEEIPAAHQSKDVLDLLRNGENAAQNEPDGTPLRIVEQPQAGSMTRYGDDAPTLTVEAAGGLPPYSYQWYRGAIVASQAGGSSGTFTTVCGPRNKPAQEYSEAKKTVATEVSAQVSEQNEDGSWTVIASGRKEGAEAEQVSREYEKMPDGAPLPGEWDNALVPTLGGAAYFCAVTDAEGNTVYSDSVLVTWKLRIASQTNSANLGGAESVTLTCQAADGTEPYAYTWNDMETGKTVGEGSTVTVAKVGQYTCNVSDALDMITSEIVLVYAADPLTVSGLKDLELKPEETGEFSAQIAGGVPPYECQWFYTPDENASPFGYREEMPGETNPTLNVSGNQLGQYLISVTDAMGETASQTVKAVKWIKPLTIETQPTGGALKSKTDAHTLSVKVSDGEPPYTYTLLREGEKKESAQTYNSSCSFTVGEGGVYAIHIVDSEGRKATSQYVEVTPFTELRIKDFTREAVIYSLGDYATLKVEAEGGKEPYTYTWYKVSFDADFQAFAKEKGYRYIEKTIIDTKNPFINFIIEPFTTWKCVVTDANGDTVVAYPMAIRYEGETLTIIQQPKDVKLNYSEELYSATLTCKAMGNQSHPLKYTWERKGDNGWKNFNYGSTLTVKEIVTETVRRPLADSTFRCRVTDTVSGKEVVSNEANIITPELTAEAYQVLDTTTLKLEVQGGVLPYTISCIRERKPHHPSGMSDLADVEHGGYRKEEFKLSGYLTAEFANHSAVYTISSVSRAHKRYCNLYGWDYVPWRYEFTIVDAVGNTTTVGTGWLDH